MMELTPSQRAAVEHRGSALLIAAGAGSGKTRVLVERLMDRICRDGLDIDRFLIITYTRAAAAELRGRIQKELSDRLAEEPKNRHLRRQTALVGQASIGTIHSLCGSVLREYAAVCGIRPDFRQADETEQAVLKEETVNELLRRSYGIMDERFRLLADTMGAGTDDRELPRLILSCYENVQSHPKPELWLKAQRDAEIPDCDASETVWGQELLKSARRRTEYWHGRLETALELVSEDERLYAAYSPAFLAAQSSLSRLLAAMDRGWDAVSEQGKLSYPRLGSVKGAASDPAALAAKSIWNGCKDGMKKVTELFEEKSDALMEDMRRVKPLTDELFRLTEEFGRDYAAEKQRRGVLDFSDLEHMALDLLTDEDGNRSGTARQLAPRWEEILVDEYQDCNRVQELIFQALSRNGENITMVGDVKQSIYRFRLADPGIFLEKYARFTLQGTEDAAPDRQTPENGKNGTLILLSENFRSDAGVLRAVNRLFGLIMSEELGELNYGEAESLKAGGEADTPAAFELQLAETEEEDDSALRVEAKAVALRTEELLHSGMRVGDRPLMPGDIAILLRSAKGRDGVFAAALEERGIPASCQKAGDGFSRRQEILWAVNLLKTIDNPRQDIPLIAALSSPVWGFGPERLAEIRCADRKGCFFEALQARAEQDERCAEVLRELEDYRLLAAELPADRLLTELYAKTGLPAAAEARENGSSAWLEELVRYAGELEKTGTRGLFRFLRRLQDTAKQKLELNIGADGGGGGVRITTIHASKGLEYPVVILADLSRRFHGIDGREKLLLHPELGAGAMLPDTERGICYPTLARLACAERLKRESLSEEMRVLYVGMTRAKQKLIAFCRCRNRDRLLGDLAAGTNGGRVEPQALADCSDLGKWLLTAALAQEEAGDWRIREAAVSSPEAEEGAGFRITELGQDGGSADEGLVGEIRNAVNWRYPHEEDTLLPSKLTATALRETALQREAAEGGIDGTEVGTPRAEPEEGGDAGQERPERPNARRGLRDAETVLRDAGMTAAQRGTALHTAMQYAEPAACTDIAGARAELRRLTEGHWLSPAQAEAVNPYKLRGFYTSEIGRRILRCPNPHREFKFSVLTPSGSLLQGVVDCWLEEDDGIVIVDYKTDYVTAETQEERAREYAPQLEAYRRALERITGKPVKECLIYFFGTGETVRVGGGQPQIRNSSEKERERNGNTA